MDGEENEIVPTDKGLRKKLLVTALIMLPVALLVSRYLLSYIEGLKLLEPETAFRKMIFLFRMVTGLGALGISACSIYFITFGVRTYRQKRYPPKGVRLIRDTEVRTGRRAEVAAVLIIALSLILIILSYGVYFYFPWKLEKLHKGKAGQLSSMFHREQRGKTLDY
ncbi:MAG: hypothetical protein HQL01_08080 [Nitrospirae bacterium]|nr:hypothetical protein [Nitrospirota bacterium]